VEAITVAAAVNAGEMGVRMLGRVLKGRYKLIDERGNGSMATVYVGRDLETNRIYAVKVLSRQAAAEKELVERFQREFELLSRLSGPHVVSPVDFGDERGNLFIVMSYVDGHTLKHAVLTGGPFAATRAIDVTQQATSGIAAAADKGIVHRDIKPQNLLLSADGVVKLTDFGLARSHESRDITVTGFFVGTPFYVAPEQVENSRRADVRADLYSMACVFFELLSGRVPYDGEHAWDVVMQHLNGQVPSICALRPDLPAAYDAFLTRALAKRPDDRFQTPAAFMEALDALHSTDGTRPGAAAENLMGTLIAPSDGSRFALTAPDVVVGRRDPQRGFAPDVDLLAVDQQQTVSRRHARFTRRAGRFFIEDLNAYNRTRVNGLPLVPHQEHELHDGDTVRLGNVELRFEIGPR
jgi:eukaryotic-like serine/threonine-protein kinase